jgi:uncharacterized DUF497 family protein
MEIDLILWDDEDDPRGNYQHIVGAGEVTIDEVEAILYDPRSQVEDSRSSERPIAFGTTTEGRRLAVVFEIEPDDDLVLIRPVTAFPVPDRGE